MKGKKKVKGTDKKNLIMGIAMMVIAVALASGTYAYYVSNITGTVTGTIVQWECKAGNSTSSFDVAMGDLKPGSSGDLAIALSVKNFQALFTVSLSNATNIPTNMKFYTSSATKTSATCLSKTGASVSGCNLASTTKTLDATSSGTASDTLHIYFDWPIGTAAETAPTTSQTASIKINVACKQLDKTPYGA